MNFELSEDQARIRDAVRDFAETRIAPGVVERERHETFPREVVAGLAEMGILGMMVPEEYGGAGADALSFILMLEELARVCASTAVIVSVNNSVFCYPLWKFGSEEQKRTILTEVASGRALGAYGLDRAAVRLRRGQPEDAGRPRRGRLRVERREGLDHQRRRGEVVPRHGDDGPGRRDPRDHRLPGVLRGRGLSRRRRPRTRWACGRRRPRRSISTTSVCRPRAAWGQEGEGFTIAMRTLDHSRIGIAAQGIGIARACYDASVEYARTRETFGKKLAEHEIIAFQIADMRVQIEASKLLTYRAAVRSEIAGVRISREASMAKVFATEACNAIAARAVQIFGGYGYSKEYAGRALLPRRPRHDDLRGHERDPAHGRVEEPAGGEVARGGGEAGRDQRRCDARDRRDTGGVRGG